MLIMYFACNKNPLYVCFSVIVNFYITLFIKFNVSFEHPAFRNMADSDKNSIQNHFSRSILFIILNEYLLHPVFSDNFSNLGIPQKLNILIVQHFLLHCGRSPKLISSMNNKNFG